MEERQTTRERILDVALDLFVEQGYDATSLRQIAEVMGFTKAALYYHFASKADILFALHLRLHAFGERAFRRLGDVPATLAVWSDLLSELLDELLAQRRLLLLHQRNGAAIASVQEMHQHTAASHDDIGDLLREILRDPAVDLRQRVRLGSAMGAVFAALAMVSDEMGDVPLDDVAVELRGVIRDILRPASAPEVQLTGTG